jgi:ATP/maltotriose-dependent transcriptional regulator MalT
MGDLNDLARRVEQIAREAERRGDIYALATVRTGVSNLVWLRRGDVQTARKNALDASKQWTQRDYQNQHYWAFLALTRIEMYEDDPRAARARVTREWSRIARALILEVRLIRVEAIHLRASTALAVARDSRGGERSEAIRAAERDARRLERMNWTLATPFAQSIRAGVLALQGTEERACILLDSASRGFDELGMALHAACNKWQHATLSGGDLGRQGIVTAEAWMAEQEIDEPARMAELIAPGFRR